MAILPMIRSKQSGMLTIVANGKSFVIPPDHVNYTAIHKAAYDGRADIVEKLADVARTVRDYVATAKDSGKDVEIKNGAVYYKGEQCHGEVCRRILELIDQKLPFEPMAKFLANLMANPSKRARNELFGFLEYKGLPITEDGCFLGYKAVRSDWMDKHSGLFDNHPGKVHTMQRHDVDDDYLTDCSYGFHVGTMEYVSSFGGGDDRILIVKVNPKDVVTVPPNEKTKLRTCEYTVVQEHRKEILPGASYRQDGNSVVPTEQVKEYAEDRFDDEEEEDEVWDSELEDEDDEDDEDDDDDDGSYIDDDDCTF